MWRYAFDFYNNIRWIRCYYGGVMRKNILIIVGALVLIGYINSSEKMLIDWDNYTRMCLKDNVGKWTCFSVNN